MGEQTRVHRHAGVEAGLQRVAVRRRLGGDDSTGQRAGAGDVFDDEGLSELLGKLLADDARNDVGPAARSRCHDDGDRPGRKFLRREWVRNGAKA